MDPQITTLIGLVIVAAFSVFMFNRYSHIAYVNPEDVLRLEVGKLITDLAKMQNSLNYVQERYQESLIAESNANRRIFELEHTVAALQTRIEELGVIGPPKTTVKVSVPMLQIVGNERFGEADRVAFRKAQIPFRRLTDATRPMIADEIRRRRLDGSMYPWITISAHMGKDGVLLEAEGAMVPASWWNEQFGNVEILLLNGCESLSVADELVGLVEYVVSLAESIPDDLAAAFAYAFWRRVKAGKDAGAAFRQAIAELPSVGEYADIRTG